MEKNINNDIHAEKGYSHSALNTSDSPADEELLLKALEPGAVLSEEERRALVGDAALREECLGALEVVSACRRDREHVDAGEALARFHASHHATASTSNDSTHPIAPITPIDPIDPTHPIHPIGPITPIDPITPIAPTRPSRSRRHLAWLAAAAALIAVVVVATTLVRPTPSQPLATVAPGHQPILLDVGGTTKPISVESTLKPINLPTPQATTNKKKIESVKVSVPTGQSLTLRLPDGSTVSLYPNSTISYPSAFTGDERRVTLSGKATFHVVHDAAHPFFVDAEGVETKVLGTMFNISTYSGAPIRVTLIEGSIQVCDPYHCVVLNPGEQAAFFQTKDMTINNVDVQTFKGWLKGRFYYHDASVSTLVEDLCKYYDKSPDDLNNIPPYGTKANLDASRTASLKEVIDILNKTNKFNISIR